MYVRLLVYNLDLCYTITRIPYSRSILKVSCSHVVCIETLILHCLSGLCLADISSIWPMLPPSDPMHILSLGQAPVHAIYDEK